MIQASAVPDKAASVDMKEGKRIDTIAGMMDTNQMVTLRNAKLLEFDKTSSEGGFLYA